MGLARLDGASRNCLLQYTQVGNSDTVVLK
jgi:hypothetical protein